MQNTPLWTRNFILLTLSGFLLALAFYMLIPTLPVFLVEGLGADKSRVGWIIAVYTLAALLVRPFTGYWIDSRGRKLILLGSLFLFAVLLGFHLIVATVAQLLVIRFLHGLSWGMTTTTNSTFIVDIVPEKRRGEGIGIYGMAVPLAMALGPMTGLWIMGETHYNWLFIAGTIIAGGAGLLALLIRFPLFSPQHSGKLSISGLLAWETLPVSIAIMITMMSYGGVISFITLYTIELGLGSAGIFFAVYAVGLFLSRLVAGRIFDRSGPVFVGPIGLLLVTIGLSFLWFYHRMTGFVLSGFLIGLGYGVVFPTFQAMANNLVGPGRRGAANSTFFTALDLGIGIGAVLTGYLSQLAGLINAFGVLALITAAGIVWYLAVAQPNYLHHSRNIQ